MKKFFVFLLAFLMVVSCFFTVSASENYEMLENGSFEENDEFTWLKFITSPGIIEYFDEEYSDGEYSMYIYDRTHCTDTIRQYITEKLNYYGKGKYQLKAKVKLYEEFEKKVCGNAVVRLEDTAGAKWFTDTYVEFKADNWAEISFVTNITWSGQLKLAEFYFITDEAEDSEYYASLLVDECSMVPLDYKGEVYVAPTPSPTPEPTPKPTPRPTKKPTTSQNTTVDSNQGVVDNNNNETEQDQPTVVTTNSKQSIVIGVMLILIGVILLAGSAALFIAYRKEKQNEKIE